MTDSINTLPLEGWAYKITDRPCSHHKDGRHKGDCSVCTREVLVEAVAAETSKLVLQVSELELQREAWRPVLQAAIVLIGKNVARPEIFRDAGDQRKYELALTLSKMGDEARARLEQEKDALRLNGELRKQLRTAQEVINKHATDGIEGLHCVDCEAAPDEMCDCPMLVPFWEAMKGYEEEPIKAPPRICYFAEVNWESKAACPHCKDLTWPNPGWISSKGAYLTNDPHEAKWWETKEQAVALCGQSHVRHWHLYATEHMFMEKRKCVAGCMDRHFCNAPKLHEGGCHCKLDE